MRTNEQRNPDLGKRDIIYAVATKTQIIWTEKAVRKKNEIKERKKVKSNNISYTVLLYSLSAVVRKI